MAEKEPLMKIVQRLATDEEFRRQLMITRRDVLMDELGISGEAYDALVGLIPVVLAGGLIALGDGASPASDVGGSPQWGSWA